MKSIKSFNQFINESVQDDLSKWDEERVISLLNLPDDTRIEFTRGDADGADYDTYMKICIYGDSVKGTENKERLIRLIRSLGLRVFSSVLPNNGGGLTWVIKYFEGKEIE